MATSTTEACERILETAAGLFSSRGYHGVSVELIAAESGVAKGTVYYHFKGKENLYFAILLKGMDRMIGELQAIVATGGPPLECLDRVVRRIFDFFAANRSFFQILIKPEQMLNGEHFRNCLQKRRAVHELLRKIIDRGVTEKVFRAVSSYDASTMLQGMIRAFVLDSIERETGETGEAGAIAPEGALDIFLNGLAENGKAESGR